MKSLGARILIVGAVVIALGVAVDRLDAQRGSLAGVFRIARQQSSTPAKITSPNPGPAGGRLIPITIEYPEEGSIFPPEITPPTFLWRDTAESTALWAIEVEFPDGSPRIRVQSRGEVMNLGEIDPRCVAETNELPKLSPSQTAIKSWKPDDATWDAIKNRSVAHPAMVTITGFRHGDSDHPVSTGKVAIQISKDAVCAPIFYRDVPLMPAELEKGVIKPLVPSAVPLVSWRLRYVGEPRGRLLMEGLPTCANCHSFSLDGKTMGMDVDGPRNDKGMYAIVPVAPQVSIRNEDVFTWNDFPNKPDGHRTIGFMAQISPDGRYAVTTLNEAMYVVNFKDYRFLQVFYPTRGILAWYNRATRSMQALPGADNPYYVQTDGFWSPDGKYLVFARARAKDPYPEGRKLAEYANDPNENPIQYDLYRIPFNEGKGGRPSPIAGASRNGKSNTFPKVSPDGRWIVFVQCRNGQLMRPDGQLFIVPAQGGQARKMRCNTSLMNSWHSFSPNGRWLIFSSKSRSPYTQMFLTHLDEEGLDSPPILIENATAANRAVNIPEFVNIPPDGLSKIDVPAAEFYRIFDRAWQLAEGGQYSAAIAAWKKALDIYPEDAKAHNNLGRALAGKGDFDEAISHWQKALAVKPNYAEAHNNLGVALIRNGRLDEAIVHFRKILEANGEYAEVHNNLGRALDQKGKLGDALAEWRKALAINPRYAEAYNNMGTGLFRKGKLNEAIAQWQRAVEANPNFAQAHFNLGNIFNARGNVTEALAHWRRGLRTEPDDIPALKHAAWLLATCPDAGFRNGREAIELAERAVRISGGRDPEILDTLAVALAETGRFAEAVEITRRALALSARDGNQPLAEAMKSRMVLYEFNRPYRETRPTPPHTKMRPKGPLISFCSENKPEGLGARRHDLLLIHNCFRINCPERATQESPGQAKRRHGYLHSPLSRTLKEFNRTCPTARFAAY